MAEEINNFHSVLVRLHTVGIRLQHTNFVLDEYANFFMKGFFLDHEPSIDEQKQLNKMVFQNQVVLTALFERLVINLYNLKEAHGEFKGYIQSKGLEGLEKSLEDCWNPIEDQCELIAKWRNQILAHGKTWNKDIIFAITDITTDTFEARQIIHLCAAYAVIYTQGITKNIPDYQEALKAFIGKHQDIPNFNYKDYLKLKPQIEKILEESKSRLQRDGFNSDIELGMK